MMTTLRPLAWMDRTSPRNGPHTMELYSLLFLVLYLILAVWNRTSVVGFESREHERDDRQAGRDCSQIEQQCQSDLKFGFSWSNSVLITNYELLIMVCVSVVTVYKIYSIPIQSTL